MREQLTEKGHIEVISASAGVGNLMAPFEQSRPKVSTPHSMSMFAARCSLWKKALAFLRDHASIILNGAARSTGRGFPTITVCAASKAALGSFARTWTSALQDRKIRVNVLNPGGIATAAQDFLPPGAQEIYAEDGSLREAKMVTVPGINHLTWCAERRLRNDGHSLPVL
jgi:NAD(P)-dependent dehydrogenase (short-subunit alcohol dehydrogenase family)